MEEGLGRTLDLSDQIPREHCLGFRAGVMLRRVYRNGVVEAEPLPQQLARHKHRKLVAPGVRRRLQQRELSNLLE